MENIAFYAKKVFTESDMEIDPIEYSKFKFGSKSIARKFGEQLAQRFLKLYIDEGRKDIFTNKQIVVLSSPYSFIPTATFAMKDYFIREVNNTLVEYGLPVIQETKIHRTITYKDDYGELNAEQRHSLIQGDSFHIDKEFVKGKLCIFLDDIIITGSHQRVIERMIGEYNLDIEFMFLYYAALVDSRTQPQIENYLNYAFVKGLPQIDEIINNEEEGFLLNTRTVKYILKSTPAEFVQFIHLQTTHFTSNLFHQAIGNSYHLIDEYKKNLLLLQQILQRDEYRLKEVRNQERTSNQSY